MTVDRIKGQSHATRERVIPKYTHPIKVLGITIGYCDDYLLEDNDDYKYLGAIQFENVTLFDDSEMVKSGKLPAKIPCLVIDYFNGYEVAYDEKGNIFWEHKS